MWNNKKWVARTPLLSTFLVESANLIQLARVWQEGTGRGQSITAWMCIGLALLVRFNYYRVIMPNQRLARICVLVGMVINVALIVSLFLIRGSQ